MPHSAAYGWKNALQLAKAPGSGFAQVAQKNADTLALFAAGVRLLKEETPRYVSEQGKIETSNPISKRDDIFGLEQPSTPAAFETFITAVRERYAAETNASRRV